MNGEKIVEFQDIILPKLVVFDCDACLWTPECFQIAPPFEKLNDHLILDKNEVEIKLFPGAIHAIREIKKRPEFKCTQIALASTTRYPEHSRFLRDSFRILEEPISSIASSVQVFYAADKSLHFKNIKLETGIDFSDMLFFDDCTWGDNVGEVESSCPGVVGVRTPHGMTVEKWNEGLLKFSVVKNSCKH